MRAAIDLRGAALELWEDWHKYDEIMLDGPAGCVSGDTELWDPAAGKGCRIDALVAAGERPWVLTVNGPVLADVPFVKGWAPLYRVTLGGGASCLVTADHKFLGRGGWVYAGSLLPGTELLSGLPSGVRRWSQTALGSPGHCLQGSHQCGEQPLSALGSDPAFAPSRIGARELAQNGSRLGDLASTETCTHHLRGFALRATQYCSSRPYCGPSDSAHPRPFSTQGVLCGTPTGSRSRGGGSFQRLPRSPQAWPLPEPCVSPCLGSESTPPVSPHEASSPHSSRCGGSGCNCIPASPGQSSCVPGRRIDPESLGAGRLSGVEFPLHHCTARWEHVESIVREGEGPYYDLHVPGEEHYLANGMWSHNTGKSIVVAWLFDQLALNYPGCRLLVVRKTRASLTQSWMVTFQKAMKIAYGDEHDYLWEGAGNANRNSYVYRNGSEIVLGGMDNPTRLFSTEYDVVYVNEVNELALGDWESLNRACRNGVIGHNLLLADCNPAEEYHWANLRCRGDALVGQPETGRTHRMVSLHEDNPWITGTREGQKYLDRLRNQLTGVRRQRLYLGLWVSAEGAVYPQFSDQTHVVHGTLRSEKDDHYRGRPQDAPTIWFLDLTRGMGATVSEPVSIRLEWFFGSQDWGWTNPGHQSIWGVDKEGRMYLVWEWMRCEKMHQWWAERAVEANKKFGLWKMVCDNAEPEAIKVFNNMLSWSDRGDNEPLAIGCEKTRVGNRTNIDLVRDRLKVGADGHPRLMFLDDALRHKPDAMLEERGAPYCTAREVPGYVYGEVGDGKENREIPKKINDHGLDDMAYAVRYAHGRDMSATSREVEWSSPLSWGALADLPAEEHKLNMAGTQEMVRRRNA